MPKIKKNFKSWKYTAKVYAVKNIICPMNREVIFFALVNFLLDFLRSRKQSREDCLTKKKSSRACQRLCSTSRI